MTPPACARCGARLFSFDYDPGPRPSGRKRVCAACKHGRPRRADLAALDILYEMAFDRAHSKDEWDRVRRAYRVVREALRERRRR